MKMLNCPKGHGPMEQKKLKKQKTYRGIDIEYITDAFVCPECSLEAGTVKSAGEVQRAIADVYREKTGLLAGREIKSLRENKGLTQQQLADIMKIGVASIKRWEAGMIQSGSMDRALRMQLLPLICYTTSISFDKAISLVTEIYESDFSLVGGMFSRCSEVTLVSPNSTISDEVVYGPDNELLMAA